MIFRRMEVGIWSFEVSFGTRIRVALSRQRLQHTAETPGIIIGVGNADGDGDGDGGSSQRVYGF